MPVCFQLIDKTTDKPAILQDIDREMCKHFKQPCDKVKYFAGWYDCIGLRLALGDSFEKIREEFIGYIKEDKSEGEVNYYSLQCEIITWLEENYTPTSFYQYK